MISKEPTIGEAAKMTPLEKRLARRIHNQRRRLRQMEMFNGNRNGEYYYKMRRAFMKIASERWNRIRELEAKLSSRDGEAG